MQEQTFEYLAEFEPIEVITKGEKHYFIEGYVSTIDEDLSLETVTKSAQMDILDQVRDRTITMDAEHEIFYDDAGNPKYKPSSPIPLGKIVNAEIRQKGVWVKAELNPHTDRFDNVWKSILKGFVHSFSVAFIPIQAVKQKVNGIMKSFVERLNLVNITLTGNPMNPNATFTPVMKTAALGLDSFMEEIKMSEKAIVKADSEEEMEKKPKKSEEEDKEELKKKADDETKEEEESEEEKEKKKKLKKKKEDEEAEEKEKEAKEEEEEKVKTKALINDLQANLKALQDKVEALEAKPVMKGRVETQPKLDETNSTEFKAFNYIK